MTNIVIDGHRMNIDVAEVLSEYPWHHANWRADKLVAASPFRDESHPSFFVNLVNGAWGDSGAYDEHYSSGNLAKLLSFLRNETYEETLDYLIELYGIRELREGERISLPTVSLRNEQTRISLEESFLTPYLYRNPYLVNRGISESIQRFMDVGYSQREKAITMPWRHPDGALANVKFRQIYGKTFWYARNASPIRELVYGIDKIYSKGITTAVVCEAEIDALSWMSCGVPAIALGGTAVTKNQLDIIRRSPIEHLIKAMDNDGPGEKMSRLLNVGLRGYMEVTDVTIPSLYKDSNEALVNGVNLREFLEVPV